MAMVVLFAVTTDPRVVGSLHPQLFIGIALAYVMGSVVFLLMVSRRTPDHRTQIMLQLVVDIVALVVLMHASGGIRSGLGNLLLISIGAGSLSLPARTALTFAALATLAVLAEQSFAQLEGITTARVARAAKVRAVRRGRLRLPAPMEISNRLPSPLRIPPLACMSTTSATVSTTSCSMIWVR